VKVLIVDDQAAVCTALQLLFEVNGISCVAVSDPASVLDVIASEDVGVVIQDMNFSQETTTGREGRELFVAIRKLDPEMPILLMTAWASLETAVEMVKAGAADYVAKPWDDEKLLRTVRNLMRLRELEWESTRLRARGARARTELARRFDLRGLEYSSATMHELVTLAVHVAPSDAPVLVLGPNGSGKEKLAEIIQANSRRKDAPFVKVNAGGLPDELLEAELFGAEAGAFTGATRLRVGRFEAAQGGTLFLDEIGNLSLSGQAKLLRVSQTGEFERLGSSATRRVDVRVISATNADLRARIAAGTFREDLYFRLNVIELRVPALADRVEDIVPLAERFLREHAPTAQLVPPARTALERYEWPGNVRELQNRIQRAVLIARDGIITPESLDLRDAPRTPTPPADDAPPAGAAADDPERVAITEALARNQGVVAKAAAELGLSRQALYRRMERLRISVERRPVSG
jgi:DNA-binding NtrC family response regulator